MADVGRVLVHSGGQLRSALSLNKPVLTIGREPSNDLTLPDSRVSRHHAELRVDAGGLALTDLGSTNGTFMEGHVRLLAHQPQLLNSGDSFTIMPFTLTYQGPEQFQERDAAFAAEEGATSPPEELPIAELPPPVPPLPPIPLEPLPLPPGPFSRYLRDLPLIFQDNEFLGRYLLIFESVWEPLEQRQDHVAMYFDPRTCPASFLPWLSSWLGLSFQVHWPEGRVREFLREATDLYRWRGTPYGMARMIEVATGLTPQIENDPSDPCVFHVTVQVPSGFEVDSVLIEGLIEAHKPAHTGYVLDVKQ